MKKPLLIAITIVVTGVTAARASEPSIKKKIIEDCSAALTEIRALTPAEQDDLIPYLVLVLKMDLTEIRKLRAEPPALPGTNTAMQVPFADPKNPELWQSFQPERQSEAKRCAAEALKILSPRSIVTIPDLIVISEDKELEVTERAFIDQLDQIIHKITSDAAHDQTLRIDIQVFERLLGFLKGDTAPAAERVLIELKDRTIPFALGAVKVPDPERRNQLMLLLEKIDPNGDEIGPRLLPLLSSEDDNLRKRVVILLGKLKAFYPTSLPILVERLSDLAPEVRAATVHALGVAFADKEALSGVKFSTATTLRLLENFANPSADERAVVDQGVAEFGVDDQAVIVRIIEFAAPSNDAELRARALALLGTIGAQSHDAFNVVREASYDPSLDVRLSALASLSAFKSFQREALDEIFKLLKRTNATADSEVKQETILRVADVLSRLKPGSAGAPAVPYLVEALGYTSVARPETHNHGDTKDMEVVQSALEGIGAEAASALIKATKNKDPLIKRRAAAALGALKVANTRVYEALVDLLESTDSLVRENAASALTNLGKQVLPQVKRELQSKFPDTRLAAAEIVHALEPTDVEVLPVLIEGVGRVPCKDKIRLVDELKTARALSENTTGTLIECLRTAQPSEKKDVVDTLIEIAPLAPGNASALLALLKQGTVERTLEFQILGASEKLAIPNEEVVSLLVPMLQSDDNSVRYRAVEILGDLEGAAKAAVDPIQEIRKDKSSGDLLKHQAIVSLAKIDPESVDYEDFFIDELSSTHADDQYLWAKRFLKVLGAKKSLPILLKVLGDKGTRGRSIAADILGDFGADAKEAVPGLLDALNDDNRQLRYAALVALLKIDPAQPQVVPALRKELTGDMRSQLLKEAFGPPIIPLLSSIAAQSESAVEREMCDQLLKKNSIKIEEGTVNP